jgi:AraC-like DNA-binding protein
MQPLPLFDSWDCTPAVSPPRSRLCSLQPMGIGTPFVESLTGYVSRLADAHAVSVGDLVGRELLVVGSKPARPFGPFVPRDKPTGSHGFRGRARAANGWGESANRWVGALEKATLQTNLRFLTLLPFEGVFSRGGLFRRIRAWCPACYEDWRIAGNTVYELLLWTIRLATICPRHGQPLAEVCPHCRETMLPLGTYARPGYCSRCLEWLGVSGTPESVTRFLEEAKTNATFWHTKAVAGLLAAAPQLNSPGDAFKANFRACMEAVAEGNVLAFAQVSRLSRPGLAYLQKGRGLPEMGTLLQICHQVGIPLTAFLVSDPTVAAIHWERAKEALLTGRKDRRVPLSRTREQVRLALQEAIREQPPPSLSEIARRLNYKSAERLYDVDHALSKQVIANYRKSGRSHWWRKPGAARICERGDIRDLLEQSLAKEHPLSVYDIAVSLGYVNEGYIQRKFPELCSAIREKIRREKKARISGMEIALKNALNDELPPSLDQVRRQLGYSSSEVLRNHFPVLCDEILARRRLHRQQQILELKKTLRSALLESPAPSLASLCKRINLPRHSLEKMCPHECSLIRSGYLRARKEASECCKEQMRQEVHRIVQNLHGEGKYPTIARVRALLSKKMLNKWAEIYAAVVAARQDLSLAALTLQ